MVAQGESNGAGSGAPTGDGRREADKEKVAARKAANGRIAGHEAFQAALNGEPLETSLDILIRTAVEQIGGDVRGAFYIANAERTELSHVTGMPEPYARCVDGFKIGADSLACGLAVYTGEPLITSDVTKDPRWRDWVWLADEFGYRGVWSFPVETSAGKLVGTFAMYFKEPREASPEDHELAAAITRAAAIIISRHEVAEERARAEAAQREIEGKYRGLFETMGEGFCILEKIETAPGEPVDFRYVEGNPAFVAQTGVGDVMGKTMRQAFPEEGQQVYEAYDHIVATGKPAKFEYEMRQDGRILDMRAFRVEGRPNQVAVLFQDVTARRQAEDVVRESGERQAFLLKLADALRPLGDPGASLEEACRLLAEQLNVDRAYYVEINEAAGIARVEQDFVRNGAPSLAGEHRLADFAWSVAILRRGECQVVADTQTSELVPEADRPVSAALRIIACLAAPLIKQGRLVGALCVTASRPRKWAHDEVELVREVGERIWAAVERARAETSMRDSEERFRLIVERARDYAIFTMNTEGVVTDWHEGAEAVFGYTAGEIVGRDGHILFTPEDRAAGEVEMELNTAQSEGSAPNVRWHVRQDGARVFIDGRTIALRDPGGGALRGFLKIGQDVTERRRAEQALYESEERFRQFAENSADVLWIADATSDPVRLEYVSPAFETMWGAPRDTVMNDLRHFADFVHPEDRERVAGAMPRLLAGEAHQEQYRIIRPNDGAVRWILDTGFPVRDAAGAIIRVAGIAQDLTGRKQAEDHIREARERLRALVEGIPQLVWRAVDGGEWTWASPQWVDYTGLSDEASRDWGWLDAIHADDRERTRNAWSRAEASESFDVEYRVCHAGEQRYRWFQTRATPVRDPSGSIAEWFGTSTDIHDLRRLQDEQKVILAELQHRSRNLLAVVRSTARKTLPPGDEVEEFGGRLAALSRVQGFLARSDGFAVELGEIVRAEIEAHGDGANIRIDGPAIELPGEKAQPFALALHELATNALKYGALSADSGRLEVIWRIETAEDGTRQLVLHWTESGVSLPAPAGEASPAARRKGYGRELIERALPYQLDARTELEFAADGVRCSIRVPLAALMHRKGS